MTNDLSTREHDLSNLFEGFDLFNPFKFSSLAKDHSAFSNAMRTDISEDEKSYEIKVDLPGLDKKDINLSYRDNVLSISGSTNKSVEEKDTRKHVLRSERSVGRFFRQYDLPNVDEKAISAKYNDGVLSVRLPKLEDVNKHKIEIE